MDAHRSGVTFEPDGLTGELRRDGDDAPVPGAAWYVGSSMGDGLAYDVPEGALADASYLCTDFLLDDEFAAQFRIALHEGSGDDEGDADGEDGEEVAQGEDSATFQLFYGALPQCSGRVRLPLDALDQGQWKLDREGAWCKPLVGGERVDPAAVERIEIAVAPITDDPVRWCQSPISITDGEPPRLTDPTLPEGPLLDEFGQSTIHEWDGRTESEAELVERFREQRDRAADRERAGETDEWGGWTGREFEATGFFRTERGGDGDGDDDRWWLVTPDGHPFWSAGLDCVSTSVETHYDGLEEALSWLPDENGEFADAFEHWRDDVDVVNYQVANLIRAFGTEEWEDAWATVALGQLREAGFNTVGNWSDWEAAREAGVPYVRPLHLSSLDAPTVFRDFPDVFHEEFPDAAADLAADLEATADDPAMIGYFLGNEPTWAFSQESPAAGMLATTDACATRRELADWLADEYGGDADLADAWQVDATLDDVAEGPWDRPITDAARADLRAFSAEMVDRLYAVLSEACQSVDPNHLNLGSRFVVAPREWEKPIADHVDVFSFNCYRPRPSGELVDAVAEFDVPALIGEWHFGALDVGLPAAGVQSVPDQAARGDAYRVYLEHAASRPWCVGAHYFKMYDQSSLGRFDGENFNIGFLDVCHRPYEPLVEAARASHERLYDVATGTVEPYDDEPEYLGQ